MDPYSVVIGEYIPEYDRLDLFFRHPVGWDAVQELFLQRSEETLHPCVVIAAVNTAQALGHAQCSQCLFEFFAGVLASPVGMIDCATQLGIPLDCNYSSVDTQFLLHVIAH